MRLIDYLTGVTLASLSTINNQIPITDEILVNGSGSNDNNVCRKENEIKGSSLPIEVGGIGRNGVQLTFNKEMKGLECSVSNDGP